MRRIRNLLGRNDIRFVLFFIGCIWLVAYAKTSRDAQGALAAGQTAAKNTARLVEQSVIHSIGELDKALIYLRARIEHEKDGFSLAETASRWELMTRLTVQMAHIGADGFMKETTVRPAPTAPVDLSDREHFKAHLNTDQDNLFISKPVLGRASKKWSVQLSRRIARPDGSFGGVFVVSLDPQALSAFYRSIDLGVESVVALIGHDGTIRATGNERALALGEQLPDLGAMRADTSGAAAKAPYVNTLNGTDRLIAVRDVAKLPLTVVVGKSLKEIYRGYYEDMFWTVAIALLLTSMLAGAALVHAHRQRALRLSNLRLHRSQLKAQRTRELEKANASINELNVELANSVVKLKEAHDEIIRKGKLAQLGQLTATVAHEIRSPLGSVRTAALVVQRKLKDKDVGLDTQFQRINNGIARCDKIITELLDFARTKPLVMGKVAVDQWLAKTIEAEAKNLPADVKVSCDLGLGDTSADFDTDRMRRVIANLISNASEAMVGRDTGVATANPKIEITTRRVADAIEITVSDNGPGIPEDSLNRVLEPLFSTKFAGVGLGLPAVEKILERHSGGLRITSKVGQGTVVTAWFPVAQAGRQAA